MAICSYNVTLVYQRVIYPIVQVLKSTVMAIKYIKSKRCRFHLRDPILNDGHLGVYRRRCLKNLMFRHTESLSQSQKLVKHPICVIPKSSPKIETEHIVRWKSPTTLLTATMVSWGVVKKNRGMGFSRFPRPQLGDMRHIMPILSAAATKAEDKIQNHMNIWYIYIFIYLYIKYYQS